MNHEISDKTLFTPVFPCHTVKTVIHLLSRHPFNVDLVKVSLCGQIISLHVQYCSAGRAGHAYVLKLKE
jgi:hypothetical protein